MPDISVIQSLTRLPIGVLDLHLDIAGPYAAGQHSLTTWNDGGTVRNVSDTFGCIVQINGAIAPHLAVAPGYDDGANIVLDYFGLRICQLAQLYQIRTGVWVALAVDDIHIAPTLLRWVEDLPGKIGLYVSPTWSVDLYYLVTI